MNNLRLVAGWHVLFVGGNGKICNGITVSVTHPVSSAYRQKFGINDYTFLHPDYRVKERLGLSDLEYDKLLLELVMLEEKQSIERKERDRLNAIEEQKQAWARIEGIRYRIREMTEEVMKLEAKVIEDAEAYNIKYKENK